MKYLIAICALILPLSVGAYEPENLKRLKKTNECLKCDLSYANLRGANLQGANLERANLEGVYYWESSHACYATMPGGMMVDTDCEQP
jgi:hypothetical protein